MRPQMKTIVQPCKLSINFILNSDTANNMCKYFVLFYVVTVNESLSDPNFLQLKTINRA